MLAALIVPASPGRSRPCRAGIVKTGRQAACKLIAAGEMVARWRCVLLIKNPTPHYNSQFCVTINFWFDQEALRRR